MVTKEEFIHILELSASNSEANRMLAVSILKSKIGDFDYITVFDNPPEIITETGFTHPWVIMLAYIAGYVDDPENSLLFEPYWMTPDDARERCFISFDNLPFLKASSKCVGQILPKHAEFHFIG